MPKFKIELQITLIAVIIGAAVITTGYFAYQSLSQIVFNIHQETKPDNRLFLMKDIANDLTALENNVRLYSLTKNEADLHYYETVQNKIVQNIGNLSDFEISESSDKVLTDSLIALSTLKLELWHDVLTLHFSEQVIEPTFTELYSKLEEKKTDTLTQEVVVRQKGSIQNLFGGKKDTASSNTDSIPKGLFKRLFGSKTTIVDTTIVEVPVEKDSIRLEIQNLESRIAEEDTRITERETKLIEKNLVLTEKINRLISESEKNENASLLAKTKEVDQLAEITYKRLKIFTISAVILLLIALFVLFNYLRKSRTYQKALQKAKTEAENLARAKEQFASNVSHEVRTPVNAIFGIAEQLLQQNSNGQFKEQVSVIAQSANHLKNIINDTLDFSKIQSNKLKFDTIHFSPEDVFTEVIKLEQHEADKKGITLLYETEGEIPEALIGDPMRLKQILINLIGNAIKFTDKGNVTLKVKADKKKYLMYLLDVTVSDTGIGIPKEYIIHIFDEFVQIENQSGKKFSGTGLGLSIVKKLVELQKGTIKVSSEEGIGTEINVNIPYPQGKVENIKELRFEMIQIPDYYKNLKVLIADDEEFNIYVMKTILKKWGVSYKTVTNGNTAIQLALKEDFDFILMDMRMPGKNGIEATKEILAHNPDINIIAVTATKEKIDEEKCLAAGMKGFLLKPFSEKELVEAIDTIYNSLTIEGKQGNLQKVDIQKVMKFANGDDAFFKEMIQLFIQSTENGVTRISKALADKNWGEISEAAHKMAAPCKHLQVYFLYDKIKLLEKQALTETDLDNLPILVTEITEEIKQINNDLKSLI